MQGHIRAILGYLGSSWSFGVYRSRRAPCTYSSSGSTFKSKGEDPLNCGKQSPFEPRSDLPRDDFLKGLWSIGLMEVVIGYGIRPQLSGSYGLKSKIMVPSSEYSDDIVSYA